MFNTIEFEVQFKSPRQGHSGYFKDQHVFEEGLTLIHGANEKGKSMRAELLRYALWGRKALRCKMSEYQKLDVVVTFTLKGVDYKVTRTKSNAHLTQAGVDYATGTSPVNDAIESLFGYDMRVFDLANAVLQGQVEALGDMKPAERKSLVDNLIGLNIIDDIIKDLSDERRLDKNTLTTLNENLVEPEKPTMVEELSDQEIEDFPALKKDIIRAEAIDNELKGLRLTVPVEPSKPSDEVFRLASKINELNSLLKSVSESQEHYLFLPEGKDTGFSEEKLIELRTQALNYEACDEVTCPECNTMFNPSGEKPSLTSAEASKMLKDQRDYVKKTAAMVYFSNARVALEKFGDKEEVEHAKALVEQYGQAIRVYQAQLESHSHTKKRIEQLQHERLPLYKFSGDFEKYEKSYNLSLTARHLMVQYESYKETYDTQKAKIDELDAKITDYDNAISGLRSLKIRIKSYLVPSLNKVASAYLSQMTDGARSSVVISETFDIKVDGQPMEALSGSAKAVANLSIRLALGQTLTNSVFSVLIADEIDASMDEERAAYTAKCLRNLTGKIKQIIIISHKKLDADNYVELT